MDPREIIQSGVGAWNSWRIDKPSYAWGEYDLTHLCAPAKYKLPISRPDLTGIDLSGHNFRQVNLEGCILSKANLRGADLSGANLNDADLSECDLRSTCLRGARGTNVTFRGANLMRANLSESRFHSCDFENTCLNEVNLRKASIADSLVYGAAAWGIDSADSTQRGLHITKYDLGDARLLNSSVFQLPQNTATVDSVDLALLLHLLTTSPDPTAVLNLMSTRIVLILGRFTEKRKVVLDAIRDHLRNSKYCPVMFDFVKPGNRTFTETVSTLAHLARFIVADLSDAKVVIQELHRIVPQNPSIPVQPIVHSDCAVNVIINDLEPYPWFLKTIQYEDQSMLFEGEECKLTSFAERFIEGNKEANKRMESNG